MKFYLSSYMFGDRVAELKTMLPAEPIIGVIPNAADYKEDLNEAYSIILQGVENGLWVKADILNLQEYFSKEEELERHIKKLDMIWVQGGNTFVLRHAMKLSGLDKILYKLYKENHPLIYSGDSAGVCVLAPTLEGVDILDNTEANPYGSVSDIWWEGLNILNYSVIPHYKSTYNWGWMGKLTEEAERYMIEKNLPYKTLQDGEVIIID